MSYTLIGSEKTRAVRVKWMLEELGVSYAHHPEFPHSDEVKSHNSSGKVPVLLDGDEAITDSSAIITYLADKHGKFTNPPGSLARARQDGLMHKVLDELDAVLWTASRHSFILPEHLRVAEVEDSLKWEFERNLGSVMGFCQGDYLMGSDLTVPDIILTHCGYWAKAINFPLNYEAFEIYMKRAQARPAFQAAWNRSL